MALKFQNDYAVGSFLKTRSGPGYSKHPGTRLATRFAGHAESCSPGVQVLHRAIIAFHMHQQIAVANDVCDHESAPEISRDVMIGIAPVESRRLVVFNNSGFVAIPITQLSGTALPGTVVEVQSTPVRAL